MDVETYQRNEDDSGTPKDKQRENFVFLISLLFFFHQKSLINIIFTFVSRLSFYLFIYFSLLVINFYPQATSVERFQHDESGNHSALNSQNPCHASWRCIDITAFCAIRKKRIEIRIEFLQKVRNYT